MNFLSSLFWLVVMVLVPVATFLIIGYNKLRQFSESIREAWSNIGVTAKKQVSLVNQLIEVVKGYQESEKLVMLKVSDDVSSAAGIAQMYQQSGVVLSSVSGMAQKFPELKANDQYQRLIDSIQTCETQLENARQRYNATVKEYNTRRSSIPSVFYAETLGFKAAPYLEFTGSDIQADIGAMQAFSSGVDADRLNVLLSAVGSSALEMGSRAVTGGKSIAAKAIEGGKGLAETASEKIRTAKDVHDEKTRTQQLQTDIKTDAPKESSSPAL